MRVCAVGERLARRRSAVRAPSRSRSASASRKPERRRVSPGVEPRTRRTLSADPAALSRGGRTGTCRCTAREPVTVCRHNLGGRPAPWSAGRAANLAPPGRARARAVRRRRRRRRPRVAGRAATGRSVGRARAGLPAAHRSGRVSGIRPSDRRGPGPAGHRGRNVRSTGRCSYNLRITRRRADSCGLHRSTSQVIRRSGSGVFILFFVMRRNCSSPRARPVGRAGGRLVFRR